MNKITGRIDPSIANVSAQEIANKKHIVAIIKIKDLINIDTFVLRPS